VCRPEKGLARKKTVFIFFRKSEKVTNNYITRYECINNWKTGKKWMQLNDIASITNQPEDDPKRVKGSAN